MIIDKRSPTTDILTVYALFDLLSGNLIVATTNHFVLCLQCPKRGKTGFLGGWDLSEADPHIMKTAVFTIMILG